MKFDVVLEETKSGGKTFGYNLATTRNGHQWSGMIIENAQQMIAIAKVLLEKAEELGEKLDNET